MSVCSLIFTDEPGEDLGAEVVDDVAVVHRDERRIRIDMAGVCIFSDQYDRLHELADQIYTALDEVGYDRNKS